MSDTITRAALTAGSDRWLVDAERATAWITAGPMLTLGMMGEVEAPAPYRVEGTDAVIPVHGVLSRYDHPLARLFGTSTYEGIAAAVEAAEQDDVIKRIVLDIDSPGGTVSGMGLVTARLKAAQKPTLARAAGACCSAALYLALGASEGIESDPMAVIGSIGAMATLWADGPEMEGRIVFRSVDSPKKHLDPGSAEGKAETQAIVDDMGREFVAWVAERTGVPATEVPTRFGGGRVMSARAALDVGLIDRIVGPQGPVSGAHGMPDTKTKTTTADPSQEQAMDPENMSPEQIQELLDENEALKEELAKLREEQAADDEEPEAMDEDSADEDEEPEAMDDDKRALAEALARIDAMERDTAISACMREGRMAPAEKTAAEQVWAQGGQALFETVYGARAKGQVIPQVKGRSGKAEPKTTSSWGTLHAEASARVAATQGLTYDDAVQLVLADRNKNKRGV